MNHSDDGFAVMLLTLELDSDRDNPGFPLNGAEYTELVRRMEGCGLRGLGEFINGEMSGFELKLGYSRDEAYRLCLLLDRKRELGRAMDTMLGCGGDIICTADDAFPKQLSDKLGAALVPSFYVCGNLSLLNMPLIAVMGASGIKTDPEMRNDARTLVRCALKNGIGIVTTSELGLARAAEEEVLSNGGFMVNVLAGDMLKRMEEPNVKRALDDGRLLLISKTHPLTPFSNERARDRMRLVYALGQAAFIFTTDKKRSEAEAVKRGWTDRLYFRSMEDCPTLSPKYAKKVMPIGNTGEFDFKSVAYMWQSSQTEQLSLF